MGDLLEQQFEELNNKLTSATDPTGYLRMVSRNNLFNRFVWGVLGSIGFIGASSRAPLDGCVWPIGQSTIFIRLKNQLNYFEIKYLYIKAIGWISMTF